MNRENKYLAFTLVEMLIVMGIIVILMAVGIASGRFAIQRANRIEHQNAADQIYQGLQSYYTDNRQYPDAPASTDLLITGTGTAGLSDYIDEFDGGSQATYYYGVDSTNQEVIICVSLGGYADANELGFYCTGNGFGTLDAAITVKDIPFGSVADPSYADVVTALATATFTRADWDPETPW